MTTKRLSGARECSPDKRFAFLLARRKTSSNLLMDDAYEWLPSSKLFEILIDKGDVNT